MRRLLFAALFLLTFHQDDWATAQSTKFPLSCPYAGFGDCAKFQDYWDHVAPSTWYNCQFPVDAKQCWAPSAYLISGCRESQAKVDFIATHDAMVKIFRAAHSAGEFAGFENLMHSWEDLNGSTMDLVYAFSNRFKIGTDFEKLTHTDALQFAVILVRHVKDYAALVKVVTDIAENARACTDLEKRIPEFIVTITERTMSASGRWMVQAYIGDPTKKQVIFEADGSGDQVIELGRDTCPGVANQPTISVFVRRTDGTRASDTLPIGVPRSYVGREVELLLVKKTADWGRYSCALGSISAHP